LRVIQKRQAIPSWRHIIPGLFVLSLLFSFFIALLTRKYFFALSVIGPYCLVNLVVSVWAARRQPNLLPILPIAFANLHLAYGLGFLAGLWRWRDKWTLVNEK
jgi:hypothetical protein